MLSATAIHPIQTLSGTYCRAGPVGLLAMATCRALSARRIVAVDVLQKRLDFARQYAATDIWKPVAKEPSETSPTYSKRNAREMCGSLGLNEFGDGNDGVDLVVECAGAEASNEEENDKWVVSVCVY